MSKIDRLQEEINYLHEHALHIFTEKELQDRREFSRKHFNDCSCPNIITTFQGTGIGVTTRVECWVCGEVEDITDISEFE